MAHICPLIDCVGCQQVSLSVNGHFRSVEVSKPLHVPWEDNRSIEVGDEPSVLLCVAELDHQKILGHYYSATGVAGVPAPAWKWIPLADGSVQCQLWQSSKRGDIQRRKNGFWWLEWAELSRDGIDRELLQCSDKIPACCVFILRETLGSLEYSIYNISKM